MSSNVTRQPGFFVDGTNIQQRVALPVVPRTDDGAALGTTSLKWSDIFLASGSVINFNAGDATITHSANTLTVAGISSFVVSGGTGPANLLIEADTDNINEADVATLSLSQDGGIVSGNLGLNDANHLVLDQDASAGVGGSGLATDGDIGLLLSRNGEGNVGIGTLDPQELLEIKSTGSARLLISADSDNVTETDAAQVRLTQDGGVSTALWGMDGNAANDMVFAVNSTTSPDIRFETASTGTTFGGTARMTILNSGRVGIGQTSPAAKLEVEIGSVDAVTGLLIDANDVDQIAFQIDGEQTTADIVDISAVALTTGIALDIPDLDALTTGTGINVVSNSVDTSERYLVNINQDHASASGARGLRVKQDAAQDAVLIDKDTGVGDALQIENAGTGRGIFINQAGNGIALHIQNDGTANGIFIDQNGISPALNIDSESTIQNVVNLSAAILTSGHAIDIIDLGSLTTGSGLRIISNSADTSTRSLVNITNDNTLATGATSVRIQQDAALQAMSIVQNAASSFADFEGTSGANTTDPISTHGTAGAIQEWLQIEVNGVKRWLPAYSDPSA